MWSLIDNKNNGILIKQLSNISIKYIYLLTLPEHLRSPLVFGGVFVAYSLIFYVVLCVLLFVSLSFSFLAMALSVYFRFMSLTVPLISFVPLLI